MASQKVFDTVCGFPEQVLLTQTPMVCRLLLKSSQSISHKHPSVKKWMNSLTKLLEKSIYENNSKQNKKNKNKNNKKDDDDDVITFKMGSDDEKDDQDDQDDQNDQKNTKKNKKNVNINIAGIWSSLILLSTSYRIITSGYLLWSKQCNLILDLLEFPEIFYNKIIRNRCFETLSEIIEYSKYINNTNSYQLSLQISSKYIKFLQNLLIEIVLNNSYNDCNFNDSLLLNVLLSLYRLLSTGKNLNAKSNIKLINQSCYHCLMSNDIKIRSTAIGILILLNNNDKKYNELIDKTVNTLNYLLRDLLPSNIVLSYSNIDNNDNSKCIAEILNLVPSNAFDRFNRIAIYNNIMNGLIYLLNNLLRKQKVHNSVNNKDHNIKIISSSCSMNSIQINLPIKNILIFIINVTSISINYLLKYDNLIEYVTILNELYQNSLWILVNIIATLQKSIIPYSNIITHILLSVAKETKQLKSSMDYEIRCSLYRCISHIAPLLGPSIYDILYNDLKLHLINDLKSAQRLLVTSPPNASTINQQNKEKLVTSKNKFNEPPRKKHKKHKKQIVSANYLENSGVYLCRNYNNKLSFYIYVLKCISSLFRISSNYMSSSEKNEIELILSSSVLSCYSDAGHILINLNLIDLLNEFVSTMVVVLMSPNVYKKPYLSISSKLLSSAFGVATILSNKKLINNTQNGLKYIESVINPRSIPVYNKPFKFIKEIDGSLIQINKLNDKQHKTPWPITNCLVNRKRTFSQLQESDTDQDDVQDDDQDDNNDINQQNDDGNDDIVMNGRNTNNFLDDNEEEDEDDDDDDEEDQDSQESNDNIMDEEEEVVDDDGDDGGDDDYIEINLNDKNKIRIHNDIHNDVDVLNQNYMDNVSDEDSDDNIQPLWHY